MKLDATRFKIGLSAFEKYVTEKDGEHFKGFSQSKFLRDTELDYKRNATVYGHEALQLSLWEQWLKDEPVNIINATREACRQRVSYNLLEHRWSTSYEPLNRVKGRAQVRGLAQQLCCFLDLNKSSHPVDLGPRFDSFCQYLREGQLGCKWPFPSYLAFLLDQRYYFPVMPKYFEPVMRFHGLDEKIAHHITWERYKLLIDFVEELRIRLADFVAIVPVDIHSYVFVMAKYVVPKLG